MKLQQITRGKGHYYHVYLPKNIVEHVLAWQAGDHLEFEVISENLVLKKFNHPVNQYLAELSCPICYNHCVVIKVIRSTKSQEYKIVARCPLDYIPVRTSFSATSLVEWKWYLYETVALCDICGAPLEEQLRKHSKSRVHPFTKLKFHCPSCGRTRVKVIADEILSDLPPLPEIGTPTIIQKNADLKQPPQPTKCPTCDEQVASEVVFCGQCGTCLVNKEI